jgi:thioredoxin reductase
VSFDFDVIIAGGGPSGLSAALVLGRACRRVLVCDDGHTRNATTPGVHGFFTRDGTPPGELLAIGREQLQPYDVSFQDVAIADAKPLNPGYQVITSTGVSLSCRMLILATGMQDQLPDIEGLPELWGRSVVHCPFCHGWEGHHQPWAYLDNGHRAVQWAATLLGWTNDLTLCTNGPARLSLSDRVALKAMNVKVREEPIARLIPSGDQLSSIAFTNGELIEASMLYVRTIVSQRSDLPVKLGCRLVTKGPQKRTVRTTASGETGVAGLYVVGDASRGAPQLGTAVSDGLLVGIAANTAILKERAEQQTGT